MKLSQLIQKLQRFSPTCEVEILADGGRRQILSIEKSGLKEMTVVIYLEREK